MARNGAWVDSLVFTVQEDSNLAVAQLESGDIDIYAFTVGEAELFKKVKENPNLRYAQSMGVYNELTFNPVGPEYGEGELNPFSNPKIREAMNWLVDRNYIAEEIMGGLAVPKFLPVVSAFPDYARYVDTVRAIEAKYAYNMDKAQEVITAEMEGMGAELVDGKWTYNGDPVVIKFLIRTEDERKEIGDYVANQLEALGFTVDRMYKTSQEASPLWIGSDPAEGQWTMYTGGWITTAISRDDGDNFSFFYTNRGISVPLWQAYQPDPEFDEVALKLENNDFATMEERGELFR
ncbi:MAG TPA: ABC transporter substrate-binding protein, partial [Anaerolineae bacterium]|nr:ABC transporter substrate-binding protein [Anaerolineae bacterium]